MPPIELPNGLKISAVSSTEAAVLYHEIYTTRAYWKHGIALNDGAVVFDVGANIGLFSLSIAQSFKDLKIFAFEPIPSVFSHLEKNATLHMSAATLKLINAALASKTGTAVFDFDPDSTFTATMRPDQVQGSIQKNAPISAWAEAITLDLQRIGKLSHLSSRWIVGGLHRPLSKPILVSIFWLMLALSELRKRFAVRRIECRLMRLSDVILSNKIERIDLLKIDVEGSESDVLAGIDSPDWARIQQLVIEVHDADGRATQMQKQLQDRGFQTVLDQEDWAIHKLLGVRTLYARRTRHTVESPTNAVEPTTIPVSQNI